MESDPVPWRAAKGSAWGEVLLRRAAGGAITGDRGVGNETVMRKRDTHWTLYRFLTRGFAFI